MGCDMAKESRKAQPTADEKLLELAYKRFKSAEDAQADARENWKQDVEFALLGNQWPENIKRDREVENRPCLTTNKLPQYIKQVTNDQRQNRPAIKVRPVDDAADPETAEIIQGIIRHIESNSNSDIAIDNAFFYAVAASFGFFRVVTDYIEGTFEQDIYIKQIPNALAVYYDPMAREPDGSDWGWCFVVEDITKEDFESRYPNRPAPFKLGEGLQSWMGEKTVRIAEYFYKESGTETIYLLKNGEVVTKADYEAKGMKDEIVKEREQEKTDIKWCLLGGDSILERKEWAGAYIPVLPVFGDMVTKDGKPTLISLIRFAKDAQMMYNYYRSTETEIMALQPKAPFIGTPEQFEGHEDQWADANSSNQAFLPYNAVPNAPAPQRQGYTAPPSGVLQGAANAEKDLMSTIGIYEAGLGMRSNEQSGRAILARQKEGDIATFHFIDNLTRTIRHLGRLLVDLIPKIYDTPRVARIMGEDGSEQRKQINAPIMEKKKNGQEVQRIYDLGLGRYDVAVTVGPSFNTRRQEAAEAMTQMVQANPALMQVAGDLIMKSMDFPGADDLAERLRKTLPPELAPQVEGEEGEDGQPQLPPQVMQQMQQMQQQIEQMGQALQQADAQLNEKQSKQQMEAMKLQIEQFRAETDRMKAESDAQLKAAELAGRKGDNDITELEKVQFEAELAIRLKEMDIDAAIERDLLKMKAETAPQVQITATPEMECEKGEGMKHEKGEGKHGEMMETVLELTKALTAPKRIIKDAAGNPVGVERVGYELPDKIERDENGDIEGTS